MVVKLEHAGVTVELKPDDLGEDYPIIRVIINGKQLGYVWENGEFFFGLGARVVIK